ncbi:hypothetical protein [Oscillatoria acuminata]|uniref:Uncharacterized protein n=1 Tax=Oscillatoria acuminata PCC 6304 TaxID=56110 RepID=K9TG30_9CYAN|nr:hypothetical protein [Oscillatoria acuminata]AFY80984.1 hypothetical protein Oscil6304_1270 [Oscillatoria acuminata PCC 6304]
MDEMAKTVLACWLSLQRTEVRLNAGEELALENIIQQLHQHGEAWESLQRDLIRLIQENPSLNRVFQGIKPELDKIETEELRELFIKESEVSQANLASSPVGTFDVATANNPVTHSEAMAELLVQLATQMQRQIADPTLATPGNFQKSKEPEEVDDEAFALACALVDEYELGWNREWQQIAITTS